MTSPKTLSLNTRQWRVLLHDNLDVLKAQVAGSETINEDGLKAVHAQLDDMKMLAAAWFQVGVPSVVHDICELPPVKQEANGAAPPKKRGRRSNAEKAALAAQAVQ